MMQLLMASFRDGGQVIRGRLVPRPSDVVQVRQTLRGQSGGDRALLDASPLAAGAPGPPHRPIGLSMTMLLA
jgi:hypothetical protein